MTKKISVAAIQALKEALSLIYWYKPDLKSFLVQVLPESNLLHRLNWDDYKRNVVGNLIDQLVKNEEVYQSDLIRLISEVCEISDFSHLKKLEDGNKKATEASKAVEALRNQLKGYQGIRDELIKTEQRRDEAKIRTSKINEVQQKIENIKNEFFDLIGDDNPQKRGYKFEKILKGLFQLFDLDPKASFKIVGEQIDGSFSFFGTDFLLEAKWQKKPVSTSDLDSLAGKLSRKLDNTLGLYISISGYSDEAVKTISSGRRMMILMDGSDLMAVLENRIDLVQLLQRKKRKASETGNIYLKIHEIL